MNPEDEKKSSDFFVSERFGTNLEVEKNSREFFEFQDRQNLQFSCMRTVEWNRSGS
jgi:hypothetical protein